MKYRDTKTIKAFLGALLGSTKGISVTQRTWTSYFSPRGGNSRGSSHRNRRVTVRFNSDAATMAYYKRQELQEAGLNVHFGGYLDKKGKNFTRVTSGTASFRD